MIPGGWDGRHEDFVWPGPGMIRLHPVGGAYSVVRQWAPDPGRYEGWYVNLEQPWRQTPLGFDTRDDVLDITIDVDGAACQLKDDDELDWLVQTGGISAVDAANISQTAETVISRIEAGSWPFDEGAWLHLVPDAGWPMPYMPDGWADTFDP